MRRVVNTEIEQMATDTYDKIDARLIFEVNGRRNVPNLESIGKAADAATWLFEKMIELGYKKQEEHQAALKQVRDSVKTQYLTPTANDGN